MTREDYNLYARSRGWIPDWIWYQINGKSLQENYDDWREKHSRQYAMSEESDGDLPQIRFTSEVKLK